MTAKFTLPKRRNFFDRMVRWQTVNAPVLEAFETAGGHSGKRGDIGKAVEHVAEEFGLDPRSVQRIVNDPQARQYFLTRGLAQRLLQPNWDDHAAEVFSPDELTHLHPLPSWLRDRLLLDRLKRLAAEPKISVGGSGLIQFQSMYGTPRRRITQPTPKNNDRKIASEAKRRR